ncbi:unnamed protein product [Owenia fusiformis]|uniref:Uncharacterized protein n=1 Tax=Owenia fusiformis TaxID=6347 RepID=A0A8J1XUK5_OWEFU|nr:unnamed protein product [Owenia fusiformis]
MQIKAVLQSVILACILAELAAARKICVDVVFVVQNSHNVETMLFGADLYIKYFSTMFDKSSGISLVTYSSAAQQVLPLMSNSEFKKVYSEAYLKSPTQTNEANTIDALEFVNRNIKDLFPKPSNGRLIILFTEGVTITSTVNNEDINEKLKAQITSLQRNKVKIAPINYDFDFDSAEFDLYESTSIKQSTVKNEFHMTEDFRVEFQDCINNEFHC